MATNPPPGPPPSPVTGIDLTQFAEIVNTARIDQEQLLTTPLVATAGGGMPAANILIRVELDGRVTQVATTGGFPDGLISGGGRLWIVEYRAGDILVVAP